VSKLERQTGLASESFLNPKSELISIQAVREYQKALEALAPVAMSRKTAYEMTREIFSQDAATGTSPYFAAHKAVNALKVVYTGSNSDTGLFWDLIGGPLNFVFAFMFNETQCQLQKQWEEEVLVKVQDVPDPRTRNRMLFGPERYAKQYVEESCRPFIERSLDKGFQPRQVQGREMPFDPSFLNFLRRGYKASVPGPEPAPRPDTYRVSLQALPTDVNPGAMMLPHVTVLEIFCGGKSTILQNYMDFPPAESITWSPSDCGEVTLKIGVENYLLVKEYTGKLAFAKFLKEFRNGQRTFKSREFPDASADLERMGIDAIIVKYKIRGHRPILDLLKPLPPKLVVPQPPRYIIGCWDQ
jgi:type VI secretion system protein ImpL